jgi:hypothetical protein
MPSPSKRHPGRPAPARCETVSRAPRERRHRHRGRAPALADHARHLPGASISARSRAKPRRAATRGPGKRRQAWRGLG